jgi:hypothetical protein
MGHGRADLRDWRWGSKGIEIQTDDFDTPHDFFVFTKVL